MLSFHCRLAEPALRWAHMIAGIGWIGTSFYFIALDFSLRKRDGHEPGRRRHGLGGAWRRLLSRRRNTCRRRPSFRPISSGSSGRRMLTWVTGFLLLVVQFYWHADIYLIDPAMLPLRLVRCRGDLARRPGRRLARLRRALPVRPVAQPGGTGRSPSSSSSSPRHGASPTSFRAAARSSMSAPSSAR